MALAKKKAQQDESQMVGAKKFKVVRGGGICDPKDRTPSMIRGSNAIAQCVTTPGPDPRPRYRAAGKSRG
jgi:hypothetical protein